MAKRDPKGKRPPEQGPVIPAKRIVSGDFQVVSREEWGAEKPRKPMSLLTKVNRQVLHHSVSMTLSADAKLKDEARLVREIQQGHFARGFSDIGYHYLVSQSGRIYEGRDFKYQGAGVTGENEDTVHVCVLGNFVNAQPTKKALKAAAEAFRMLPGTNDPLYGHGQLGPTECPGKNLLSKLDEVKKLRKET